MEVEDEVAVVKKFFNDHIYEFNGDGGGGGWPNNTPFDLMPRDFIDFAEKDLGSEQTNHSLVNATSNLKRAVDCQLDHFFQILNIDEYYRKKRLGVDRKLGFLEKSGLYRSKSLKKLNKFRNRLEHHYEIPEIEDVEVYFDLVVAFVGLIEGSLPAVGNHAESYMTLDSGGSVGTHYMHDEPCIQIFMEHKPTKFSQKLKASLAVEGDPVEQLENFAFFFKVHLLFWQLDEGIASPEYVLRSLEK